MIVQISYDYAVHCSKTILTDACDNIVKYGHYISCDDKTQKYLTDVVSENGSKALRNAMRESTDLFDSRTALQKKYMRTINLNDDLIGALDKPSVAILENAPYEWSVYQKMAESYKHDSRFGSLFRQLVDYMGCGCLTFYNGGGCGQHDQHILQHEKNKGYKNVGELKLFCLLDSDCLIEGDYPTEKTKVCNFLCGTVDQPIENLPIYTLQQPKYTWHMWYKRAIENYFPNNAYQGAAMDTSCLPHERELRDYTKIDKKIVKGYAKDKLQELPNQMSRSDYETGLKHFIIHGEDYSEIQLFLLKLVYMI